MTPEESLALWKCCQNMEEHLEHLAHLQRCKERAQSTRPRLWDAVELLVTELEGEGSWRRRCGKPKLTLIKGGRE